MQVDLELADGRNVARVEVDPLPRVGDLVRVTYNKSGTDNVVIYRVEAVQYRALNVGGSNNFAAPGTTTIALVVAHRAP